MKKMIKNGVVRTVQTAKRESVLKMQGYTEFTPKKKATPKPATKETK